MSENNNAIETGIKKVQRLPVVVRRAIAVTGMARETVLPKATEVNQELAQEDRQVRTLDERFERGDMFRILKRLLAKRSAAPSEQKEVWNERIHAAREISRNLARNLDILNNQYYNPKNLTKIPVELDGEDYEIPVRHYSLGEVASSQDELPLVVLGGAAAGHKTTKSTIEAFALQYPGRDVYVVSYPDSLAANIPDSFPKKIKGQEGLDVYTRLLKKTIENLGFDKFDLIGISMGGGVSIGAVKDEAFAKKIRNLMIISPTNIQETKSKSALMLQFGSELLHGAFHPREFLRVGQPQNDQELESHKGTGFFSSVDIVRKKAFTPQDLAQLHVNGRILFLAGEKDRIISGRKTLREIEKANINRGEAGKEPIEHCLVLGAHHNLGDAYAAGIVRLIRQTDGSSLPSEYPVSQLENSTAKVLVRENLKLASVADQIT